MAKLELEGSVYQANAVAADALFSTISAYWNYVAAEQRLKLRQDAAERARQLEQNVTSLIQADHLPASASHETRAAAEQEQARLLLAEQQVREARQHLGDAIGLDPLDAMLLGDPSDRFPEPAALETGPATPAFDPALYVAEAMGTRADLAGASKRIQAAEINSKAAENQLHSRLDLTVQSGYTGMELGLHPDEYFGSAGSRVQGVDVQASVTYTFDPANGAARSNLAQAQTAVKRSEETQTAVRRKIANDVITALGELETSRATLTQAGMAENEFRQALADEQERLRTGIGVVNDVITMESRLTAAELETVDARSAYAMAIASLRYATGTLLGQDIDHPSIQASNFLSPPTAP